MPNDTSAPRMKQLTIRGSRTGTRFELNQEVAVDIGIKPVEFPLLLVEKLDARPARFEFLVSALRVVVHDLILLDAGRNKPCCVEVGIDLGELEGKGVDDAGLVVMFAQDFGDDFKMLLGHDFLLNKSESGDSDTVTLKACNVAGLELGLFPVLEVNDGVGGVTVLGLIDKV